MSNWLTFRLIWARYYIWITLILSLPYIVVQAQGGGDLEFFIAAAKTLAQGKTCYHVWLSDHYGVMTQYLYGPSFALALIPLSRIPDQWLLIGFGVLNVLLLIRIFSIAANFLHIKSYTPLEQGLWYLFSIGLSARFILHNFEQKQVTIIILYLITEGFYQIYFQKKIAGAALIGIAIHIKLIPLVFIPYLLYRNKFMETFVCIGAAVGLFFLPALFYGFTLNNILISGWWTSINPTNPLFNELQNGAGYSMQNLSAFYCTYLTNFNSNNEVKVNIASLNAQQLALLVNITRALLAMFTLSIFEHTAFP